MKTELRFSDLRTLAPGHSDAGGAMASRDTETRIPDPRIIAPDQIGAPAAQIPFLLLPRRDLFERRAARLRYLAVGHPLGGYLAFLGLLADAQQNALYEFPTPSLPGPDIQAMCREQGTPLLSCRSWPRDPAWQWGLEMILQQMGNAPVPVAATRTISRLMRQGEEALEETADWILSGNLAGVSPRELPFIAAALQVYWVRMASSLGEESFSKLPQGGLCPVCGSHPNAGVIIGTGARQGLRYLSCSLCGAQWHMVRIKCSSCEVTHGIDYFTLEGSAGAVKAETCGVCNLYLKLFYLEKNPQMEPVADDLATLALDMLMDKEGKARSGPNLLFHPGVLS